MITKAFKTLKSNPVLILVFFVYMLVAFLVVYFLVPRQINQNDIAELMATMLKIFLFSLASGILGLIFFSGYANMTAEAVTTGRTSIRSFPSGIKRFFVRILLAALLLAAIYIGFCLVVGIATIPLSLILTFSNPENPTASATITSIIITVFASLSVFATIPFIILWLPAIFVDDIGVIEGLKRGMKTGVKNYGVLLIWTLILYIPTLIYTISNLKASQSGVIMAPGYTVTMIAMAILSMIYFPMIFTLYNEKRIVNIIKKYHE